MFVAAPRIGASIAVCTSGTTRFCVFISNMSFRRCMVAMTV
jgi:hypothetical protein